MDFTSNPLPWRKGLRRGAWVGDSNSMRQRTDSFPAQAPRPRPYLVAAIVALTAK